MPWRSSPTGLRIFYNDLGEAVGYQLYFPGMSPGDTEYLPEEVGSGARSEAEAPALSLPLESTVYALLCEQVFNSEDL